MNVDMTNESIKRWLSLLYIKDKLKPQLVSAEWTTERLKLKISNFGKNEQQGYRPNQGNCQVRPITLNMHTPPEAVIPFFSPHPEQTCQVYQKTGIWEPMFLIGKPWEPSTHPSPDKPEAAFLSWSGHCVHCVLTLGQFSSRSLSQHTLLYTIFQLKL